MVASRKSTEEPMTLRRTRPADLRSNPRTCRVYFRARISSLVQPNGSNVFDSRRVSQEALCEHVCVLCVVMTHEAYACRQYSYLVDPASSHMLVSKIKPCMSKYKHLYTVKLRTAHYISYDLFDGTLLHGYP
jgi:hypothetical protein